MASSTSLPPPSQSQSPAQTQEQLRQAQYNTLLTYTSLTLLLICPTLIALPPRKFDFYTVLLISGTAVGGNQVLREYTGRGIAERVPPLRRLLGDGDMDAERRVGNERIEGRMALEEKLGGRDFGAGEGRGAQQAQETTTEAVARAVREMKDAERGAAEPEAGLKVGEEPPQPKKADWKLQRDAREREALEDGRGYGGLIVDQIWEVWNWGRGTAGGEVGKGEGEGERK